MSTTVEAATTSLQRARWLLLAGGALGAAVAAGLAAAGAGAAASSDWPPFVLVTGLLLIGQVAWADGLFQAAGDAIGRWAGGGVALVVGSAALAAVVTTVLNLDTSVAFLTPVLVYAARRGHMRDAALLYLSVFMANAASLLLPGSNLTNLIVLGHHTVRGTTFALHMLPAWAAAIVATTVVVLVAFRHEVRGRPAHAAGDTTRPHVGIGLAAALAAVAAMLLLSPPPMAISVMAIGLGAVALRAGQRRLDWRLAARSLNLPVLAGLFGLAVALGALGANWSGPATALAHLSSWESAVFSAALSVCVNNLPAASLLAARHPRDPYALLIGLNLGPNLVVTGALSGVLWLQVGKLAGARPSPARMTRVGVFVVPITMAAALGALMLYR